MFYDYSFTFRSPHIMLNKRNFKRNKAKVVAINKKIVAKEKPNLYLLGCVNQSLLETVYM